MAAYRQTDEYKEKARARMQRRYATDDYRVWLDQSRELRKNLKQKYRDDLSDHYILERLGVQSAPPELIELKRITLQIKRELRKTK